MRQQSFSFSFSYEEVDNIVLRGPSTILFFMMMEMPQGQRDNGSRTS